MAKNGSKWQKILSVTLHVSGTIHHIIVIFGTPFSNDNISMRFFQFFKILSFWFVRVVKGQKTVQNYKKFYLLHFISHISGTIHHMTVIYGTHL